MTQEIGDSERKDMKTQTRETRVTPSSLASVASQSQPRSTEREIIEGMGLEARNIYAWFGKKLVLEDISMDFAPKISSFAIMVRREVSLNHLSL